MVTAAKPIQTFDPAHIYRFPVKERRKFIRHPVQIPIHFIVVTRPRSPEHHARTRDLSCGGLLFSWSKSIPLRRRLIVLLPCRTQVFRVHGDVVHNQKSHLHRGFDIGIRFTNSREALQARIAEEIYQIMLYRRQLAHRLKRSVSYEEASRRWIRRFAPMFGVRIV